MCRGGIAGFIAGRRETVRSTRSSARFEAFVERHHRLVYGIAFRTLGAAAAAEDLSVSIFLSVWGSPDLLSTADPVAKLSRLTRDRAIGALRGIAADDADFDLAGADEGARAIESERVRTALSCLKTWQKETIEVGFFEGVARASHSEIRAALLALHAMIVPEPQSCARPREARSTR